jgi:hypothetical protein
MQYFKKVDAQGTLTKSTRVYDDQVEELITKPNESETNTLNKWVPSNVNEWAAELNVDSLDDYLNNDEYTAEEKQAIQALQ